jgi:hypothetical protein
LLDLCLVATALAAGIGYAADAARRPQPVNGLGAVPAIEESKAVPA